MAQHEAIDGVVVRVRDTGDCDRYLSVLTAERGRITVLSKGSHSMKGPQTAVSQLYTYANFEYYRRGEINILKGGSPIQPFYALSADIDRMDLAAYFCDVVCEVTDEGVEAGEILRLLLNSLYAVSKDLYPQEIIKGAFEMRVAAMSGYTPDLGACAVCGAPEADLFYLDVMNGALTCPECRAKQGGASKAVPDDYNEIREADVVCILSPAVRSAMRYCISAPVERLFSFGLCEEDDVRTFARTAEIYLLSHLGRGFDSLNFYHTMRAPQKERAKENKL